MKVRYAVVAVALSVSALCGADESRSHHTSRQDLIGTWKLTSIEVQGPAGREVDPFYGSHSNGLLIYDASGWFSVQIESNPRPAVTVPAVRPAPQQSESAARLNSAALDSYYAYYGTWSFDPASSTVTHHAKGALYPSEDTAIYPQHVDVVGSHMTFTRTQAGKTQTKLWERVSPE